MLVSVRCGDGGGGGSGEHGSGVGGRGDGRAASGRVKLARCRELHKALVVVREGDALE